MGALRSITVLFVAALFFFTPCRAADPAAPNGWVISRHGQTSCDVSTPSGTARFGILATGRQIMLVFSSNDVPTTQSTLPLVLRFDGKPEIHLYALSSNSLYVTPLMPWLGVSLREAKRLEAKIGGASYVFEVGNASEAMDAATRCAGAPAFSQSAAYTAQAIPGADGWKLLDMHSMGNVCQALRDGGDVNTVLLYANGNLTLQANNKDWSSPAMKVEFDLQLDDLPPIHVHGSAIKDMVLVPVSDKEFLDHLRRAKTIAWLLPKRNFVAQVAGLDIAADAVKVCATSASHSSP